MGIIDHALVLPGDLTWRDLKAGSSAVCFLEGEFPVCVGAPISADFETPESWPFPMIPRALNLALKALSQLSFDPDRRYGLVLGLPNLFSETDYMEHALPYRNEPTAMGDTLGFCYDYPLGFVAEAIPGCGPRLRVDSACATGNDALIAAYQWIDGGLVDDVIVLAASAMLNPAGTALFHNLKALNDSESLQASCPFDRRRRGFVMGEGAAALWLSGNSDLPARGYLCGYGQSMNADKFVDLPQDPRAMLAACEGALGGLEKVAYVSAHGTATQANDLVETKLYRRLFGPRADEIPVSSIKSMIGHCLGAAALIEAIVCLQALAHQTAPPTINLNEPDEQCDLNYVPNQPQPIEGNFALSNAFAFGGHNSSILLAGSRP